VRAVWAVRVAASAIALATMACSSSDSGGSSPPRGEPGGTIAYDAAGIPLGGEPGTGDDPGGEGGSGGAAGAGGAAGGGGVAGAGGAGGGGTPRCDGLPDLCALAGGSCTSIQGCRVAGECSGSAVSCYAQFSSYACIGQDGCIWSSSSKHCSGSARACHLFSGPATCTYQEGCHWDDTCEGTPTPCSLIPIATCTSQPGCYVTKG
jgi:hypothetical protein